MRLLKEEKDWMSLSCDTCSKELLSKGPGRSWHVRNTFSRIKSRTAIPCYRKIEDSKRKTSGCYVHWYEYLVCDSRITNGQINSQRYFLSYIGSSHRECKGEPWTEFLQRRKSRMNATRTFIYSRRAAYNCIRIYIRTEA